MRNLAIILAILAVGGCAATGPRLVDSDPARAHEQVAPPAGNDALAKMAAALEAGTITLPQVAAFLDAYGFDVINRDEFLEWCWTPSPPGTFPVAYYVAEFRVAVGTPGIRIYLPQHVGPYPIRAQGYDGRGNASPYSAMSWSDGGDGTNALPGVAR